jgi:hypothetical protein
MAGAALHATLSTPTVMSAVATAAASSVSAPAIAASPSLSPEADAGATMDVHALPSPERRPDNAVRSASTFVEASSAPPRPSFDTALAQERSLLQGARVVLLRGQPDAALGLLDEHERSFPKGELVEEREVMRVQALVRARRMTEASALAALFRQRFPQSLSLPIVDAALAPAP